MPAAKNKTPTTNAKNAYYNNDKYIVHFNFV